MRRNSQQNPGLEASSLAEKLSLWIEQDEFRELVALVLDDFGVIDVHATLAELDGRIETAAERREAMIISWHLARRRMALAIYPWLTLVPLTLVIAIQSRTSIRRGRALNQG